ncbi:GntR family transcriptional regulator [Salinibacterium sp. NK8237]|uniref:GntR family transcriptional regulator n=1 Tax=Salinibacterium sp. NK8237 TaxID=2792038 RepID=UPI0018CF3A6B|nr:GntR family transcriptional regulator [Salinibacterium sp. NK8237]MBH0130185.1 GntR family transcriptional regulator [Salinibacterium sp. NK8237]
MSDRPETTAALDAAPHHVGQIDRHSAVPMYDQLRLLILDSIDKHLLGPGDLLPGEHRLCEQYEISRTVVRQALALLEIEGVVERVKGKGTFVSRPKVAESLVHTLTGLYDEVARRGGHVHSDILRHEREAASADVARMLQINPGDIVVVLDRLRWVDGEPWSLTTTWMPEAVGSHTLDVDMSENSLYAVLAEVDVVATTGTRSAESTIASAEQAQKLQINAGDPLLLLRSVSMDATGKPIEHFVAYHRGDRSRFEFQLEGGRSTARLHITD